MRRNRIQIEDGIHRGNRAQAGKGLAPDELMEVRLKVPADLHEMLTVEARRRGVDRASLVRFFARDGLERLHTAVE